MGFLNSGANMRRREFIAGLGGAGVIARPAGIYAQSSQAKRIGVLILYSQSDPQSQRCVTAFENGMKELGWLVGRNLQIDYRFGISSPALAQAGASALLNPPPDLILAHGTSAVQAAQQATHTIPIIFTGVSEPASLGVVAGIARPGGNTTGFSNLEPSVGGKWFELLIEVAPVVKRVAVLFNPVSAPVAGPLFYNSIETAAQKHLVETVMAPVRDAAEIEAVVTRQGNQLGGGMIALPDPFLSSHNKQITALAAANRLPTTYPFGFYVVAGGLISYGPDIPDEFRRAAAYADRIFKGERAGNLPVQQPIKFNLAINLKTAHALGITISPALLARADEVIE
jgi:putative ABC transport system substrate-binding protein